ncbi:MAG: hypothetical protein LBG27_06835 [Spirochaetaceae bacterium]|jgi:hypothetical protein|nr:hypothetical protein [Spirochaetaceae bacterium]
MKHANYKDILEVGCLCAGHMEENLSHAQKRDELMKKRANKRKKWLARTWKTSGKGNQYIKSDRFIIVIINKNNKWSALIKNEDGSFMEWSRRKYESEDQIKISAFDYLTRILAEKELNNPRLEG